MAVSPRTVMNVKNAVVKFADTEAGLSSATEFQCVTTSAAITTTPNLETVPATGCAPESQAPAASSYALVIAWLQDWKAPGGGLSNYMWQHDTEKKFFSIEVIDASIEDPDQVVATGEAYLVAGPFLGDFGTTLVATGVTLPCDGKPDIVVPAAGLMAGASANLQALAQQLHELPHSAMVIAAKKAKAIAEDEGRRAGSPLSGGKRSIKLSAFTEISTSASLTTCTMQGYPVGPWVWRTTGTKGHSIPRQRKGAGAKARYLHARRYAHPVKTPPSIHHPGGSGAGAWFRVIKRCTDEVPEVFVTELHKVVS